MSAIAIEAPSKKCTGCCTSKPVGAFALKSRSKNSRRSQCRDCSNAACREWNKRNPRHRAEYSREHRSKNKGARWSWFVKRAYGLSASDYQGMVDRQMGACAICLKVPKASNKKRSLSVDHCHTTGKVRKLLCARCNTLVGHFEKDETLFSKIAKYVEAHR